MLVNLDVRDFQILELDEVLVEPFAVGTICRVPELELIIVDKLALDGIDKKHFARAKSLLDHYPFGFNRQSADLGRKNKIVVVRNIIT